MAPVLSRLGEELGFAALARAHSPRDVGLLITSRFVRLIGFGAVAPLLVLYLNLCGFSDRSAGLFLTLTLLGDVVLSLGVSWVADSVGRRRVLALGSALMACSGFAFYLSRNYTVLLVAATFGVISPSGNEVGPFSSVEISTLSQLVQPEDRVFVLMNYQVLGFVGLALGSVASGSLVTALERDNSAHESYRFVFACYGAIALVKIVLSLAMTQFAELDHPPFPVRGGASAHDESDDETLTGTPTEQSPLLAVPGRPLVGRTSSTTPHVVDPSTKLDLPSASSQSASSLPLMRLLLVVALFSVDSFASSLTPASYVSLYFKSVYKASISTISAVLAGSALGAVFTSLLAGALSKRIGLVLTMVSAHVPAQILTAAMAFAPTLPSVIALYVARTCISSMDSSIRGALLSAMVAKQSRTRLLGSVDVARTLAAAPGPFVTGRLISIGKFRWVFVISGAIKIVYDLALLLSLRRAKLQH
ncbi:uncharacterized protein RHOBADRAFT_44819 [Rhodotorula graminis WP1]|uniref:Major facilitator superfamily (MFS) profile domain-containing protein n=1 Tax=Rhodotorula graminis (strain WP1) TaxID=578459 RepID=A0A194S149_RHOGW|nr:uncharacterized protein RHOBADRAFT_44819 [Rhodotorula graminis WP1]KPV74332.1 hypothetical protein RHOBADRAFT_44819 [Rhodotorula graminis WP1]